MNNIRRDTLLLPLLRLTARRRRLVTLVLAFLLTLSAFGSSNEVVVGRTVPALAPEGRGLPAAASDGDGYFIVWVDGRSVTSAAIVGTRVTRDGRILDPYGLRIATLSAAARALHVAWDGAAYLVVWTEWSPAGATNVFAARLAANGTIAMAPRIIAENASTTDGRAVASNGTLSVVAYFDYNLFNSIQLAVLDRDGDLLHRESVNDPDQYKDHLDVAASASRFVVTWQANHGFDIHDTVVKAMLVTAEGNIAAPPVTVGRGERPAVASDGDGFVIVSHVNDDWREHILSSHAYDANLTPIRAEHLIITGNHLDHTSLVWAGDRYELVTLRWTTGVINEILAVRLDRDGEADDVRSRGTIAGDSSFVRLGTASNGTNVLVANVQNGINGTPVVARMYGEFGDRPVPMLLSWSANGHDDPAIASSAVGHLVAWTEVDGVYFTRVDRAGNPLDGRGLRLTTSRSEAHAAFDGTNYIVAWRDDAGFIGVRTIAPLTGATVAEVHVPTTTWPAIALAASPDATYLVSSDERVRVTRIPHATHTPDPVPLVVSPEGMTVDHPAASWNGSALLVTWNEIFVESRPSPPIILSIAVRGARVTGGLSLLDPAPLLIAGMSEPSGETFGTPSVASDGEDWLVVAAQGAEVVARRVRNSGMLEGTAAVKIGEGVQPDAVWDGMRYAVAWKEESSLVLAAVPRSGALVATRRMLVSDDTAPGRPSIASIGDGETVLAYTRVSFLPEHGGVERSFLRVMTFATQRGRVVRR